MIAAERIAAALGMRQVKPGHWRRRCPCHKGTSDTSLSVWDTGQGKAGLHDFGGCDVGAILATVGLSVAGLYDDSSTTRPLRLSNGSAPDTELQRLVSATDGAGSHAGHRRRRVSSKKFEIRAEGGEVVAVHVRTTFNDGTKDIVWERPDGASGLNGTKASALPLYGIHELGEPTEVVVTEGEPARDALAGLGIPAVGTVTGADGVPDDAALRPLLRIPTVCLWRDHDDPGRSHMGKTGGRLLALGHPDVRVVNRPDAPPKDDAADFVAAGGTASDVRRLLADASPYAPTAGAPTKAEPTPGTLRFVTTRKFAAETPTETEWVIEPWVAVGGTTKIDGPPKRAGKATLITHMVAAVLTGTPFLGRPVRQGPVILLTEQGGTSLREALERAGLLERGDLHIALYRDISGLPWPDVVAQTFAYAKQVGAVLIVVDTFPQVARVRGDDENSAGRALEALEPLQVGADMHRIGVILSFHDRKGGGEVGESGRGASAYAGAVDIILHLNRPGGNFPASVRKIEALSRFEDTPDDLFVELTPSGYVPLGSEANVVAAQVATALVEVLPTTEEEAKPVAARKEKDTVVERGLVDDLADRDVKAARSTIDEELKRWENAGYAGRTAGGRRGSPYRFWMVTKPPTSFLRSNPFGSSEESNTDGACGAGDDPLLSSDGWNVYSEGNDDEEDRWTA